MNTELFTFFRRPSKLLSGALLALTVAIGGGCTAANSNVAVSPPPVTKVNLSEDECEKIKKDWEEAQENMGKMTQEKCQKDEEGSVIYSTCPDVVKYDSDVLRPAAIAIMDSKDKGCK